MEPKKILVVDDNPIIRKALSLKLDAGGYKTLTAEDGSEAVKTVRSTRPDLIILDVTFPPDVAHGGGIPWDGFLIMDWLRRMDEARAVPFILISSTNTDQIRERALREGAAWFFGKPVDHDQLLAAINLALQNRQTAHSG
jgi:CheY-like chemotaxis protein